MMTRRQWLALATAGVAAAKPQASPQAKAQPPVAFGRIDTHVHLNRFSQPMIDGLEASNWHVLSISVSRATGDDPSDLDSQLKGNAELHRKSPHNVAWAGSFDARRWQDADFAASTIAALQQQFRDGAIATKIWKNIGMSLRTKDGAYVMPDNPAFMPIYEMLQKQDRTLVAHLGEPNAAWMPADESNSYSRSYPTWMMYGHPGTPSKEDILTARDRIATRFPKLRIVGCHLGSNEEELDTLAKRLDRLPNFAVDLAARIRVLAAGDREKSRAFLIKYQDRITYGTDSTVGPGGDDQKAWTSLAGTHDRDWQYFSSAETMTYNRREVQGLGLPEPVLRKIFRENAVRWFPGIG